MRALLDGSLVPETDAAISPLCDGFLYGYGLFETVRVRAGLVCFWPDHHQRLTRSSAEIGLRAAPGAAERAARLIAANGIADGVLKWVLYQGLTGTGEIMTTRPYPYGPDAFARGFALRTQPGTGSPHKTLNYLPNVRARRAALVAGFEEALFVASTGHVLEGSASNLFVVEGATVLTPPLSEGILPGTARARAIAATHARETPLSLERVLAADEVFVTNALVEAMPVRQIDHRHWKIAVGGVASGLRR